MVICIAEDRKSHEPAIAILLLSLNRYCRGLSIELFYPAADQHFLTFLRAFPNVRLHTIALAGAYGWNVKPHALLHALGMGHREVVWIDSDIVVARDIAAVLSNMRDDELCITEEALYGKARSDCGQRTKGWKFAVGRVFPFALNTGVLRVTNAHRPLLMQWKDLLSSECYRTAQRRSWDDRPTHMLSDQDVLTALLGSKEHAGVPLRILQRGKDIIQFFGPYGYTCRERFLNIVQGLPPFVHAQGPKPWLPSNRQSLTALYDMCSPYTLVARRFASEFDGPWEWAAPRSRAAKVLRAMGLSYAPLTGLPLAIVIDAVRWLKPMLPAVVRSSAKSLAFGRASRRR